MAETNQKKGCAAGSVVSFAVFVLVIILSVTLGNKKSSKTGGGNNLKSTDPTTYSIDFSKDFKAGMASVDDLGLSVVLAIDCSGSMADPPKSSEGKAKYVIASESLTEIVDFLEDYYVKSMKKEKLALKVGLIKFSTRPEKLFELTEMNEKTFAELKKITSEQANFSPDGTTAIGKTLEMATEMVLESGTIFKSIIVITDGANTEGVSPETVLKAIVENRNSASSPENKVFTSSILTSFVGFDVDSSTFVSLNRLGSRVTSADSKAELKESLQNIFMADITKLESK